MIAGQDQEIRDLLIVLLDDITRELFYQEIGELIVDPDSSKDLGDFSNELERIRIFSSYSFAGKVASCCARDAADHCARRGKTNRA